MANNYDGNSISVLEGLDPVRKRPGMYIGSVGTKMVQLQLKITDEEFRLTLMNRLEDLQSKLFLQLYMQVVNLEMETIRFPEVFTESVHQLLTHYLYGLKLM